MTGPSETSAQSGIAATPAPFAPARFARASDATWPAALVERLGGWHLRFTEGAGSRAASVWAESPADRPLEAAIDAAEARYIAEGFAPRFQLWPGDEALGAALEARGYRIYDRSLLLWRDAAEPLPAPDPRAEAASVAIAVATPLAMLDEVWTEGGVGPARRAIVERAPEPKIRLLGRAGMRPAGAAAAILDGEIAVTQALFVRSGFRRLGVAATLVAAIQRYAAGQGARYLCHSVVAGNAGAIALYGRLGFASFGSYRYAILDREKDRA